MPPSKRLEFCLSYFQIGWIAIKASRNQVIVLSFGKWWIEQANLNLVAAMDPFASTAWDLNHCQMVSSPLLMAETKNHLAYLEQCKLEQAN